MLFKILVISAFAFMTLMIGVMGLRRTKSFKDFFLGGGKVGPWMTAFTYGTAYFSAVLFIGFAGKIGWNFGYSGLWIAVCNSLVGVLGVWWFMGRRIRRMAEEYNVATMPEFFQIRYKSPALKLLASLVIFVFFIPYSAAVFIGLSYLFTANFDIPYAAALVLIGGFTASYLVLGGYKSMTMIDIIFGMIMIVGAAVLISSTISSAGGMANLNNFLHHINPKLTGVVGPPGWWPLLSLVILTSVAPFAMPQLVQKFYAIRDNRSIKIGMVASTIFSIIITTTAYFTGATARFFLNPINAPNAFDNGTPVYDVLMPELLANVIPSSLSVLMLLLILSASMSTLAALVLISSSTVAKDIYAGFINPSVSDPVLTRLMRIASALFVVLSIILAWIRPDSIVAILAISWGAIGSAFLGPFIWGLIWKRCNVHGAVASSVLGLGTCLVLYIKGMPSPESGTIGMIVSFAANPIISILTPAHSDAQR